MKDIKIVLSLIAGANLSIGFILLGEVIFSEFSFFNTVLLTINFSFVIGILFIVNKMIQNEATLDHLSESTKKMIQREYRASREKNLNRVMDALNNDSLSLDVVEEEIRRYVRAESALNNFETHISESFH